jgi:hypothetical protein
MKEYLFRGKSIESDLKLNIRKGEWVYGSLIVEKNNGSKRYLIFVNYKKIIRVSPKSIGQYIGIKDIKNKKLFVGDIVEVNNTYFKTPYEIIWGRDTFGVTLIHADREGDDWGVYTSDFGLPNYKYQLIGNVYDTPRKKKKN